MFSQSIAAIQNFDPKFISLQLFLLGKPFSFNHTEIKEPKQVKFEEGVILEAAAGEFVTFVLLLRSSAEDPGPVVGVVKQDFTLRIIQVSLCAFLLTRAC